MKSIIIFISLICIRLNLILCVDKPKIAIIGAGIGGTSCALFLKDMLNESVEIHIYEHQKIGGRLATYHHKGVKYDQRRIIHEKDLYTNKLVERFQMKKVRPETNYIYSKSADLFLINLWRLELVPGTTNFLKFLEESNARFNLIYDNQDNLHTQTAAGKLLASMFMITYAGRSTQECLENFKMTKILYKVCESRLIADYGQLTGIQSFAGFVSLNRIVGPVYTIEGGSDKLAKQCLQQSKAELHMEKVIEIKRLGRKKSIVYIFDKHYGKSGIEFDYVILATPLAENLEGFKFSGYKNLKKIRGLFKETVTTFVNGKLKTEFFSSNRRIAVNAKSITFIDPSNIQSIMKYTTKNNDNDHLWKIQSLDVLSNKEIEEIFEYKNWPKAFRSVAYPDYYESYNNLIDNDDQTFILETNLFYINCIEWAASSIEMAQIGSKNVALLIFKDIKQNWGNLSESYSPAT